MIVIGDKYSPLSQFVGNITQNSKRDIAQFLTNHKKEEVFISVVFCTSLVINILGNVV